MSFEEQDSELLQSDSIIQLNQYIDYLIQQISLHHYKSIFMMEWMICSCVVWFNKQSLYCLLFCHQQIHRKSMARL